MHYLHNLPQTLPKINSLLIFGFFIHSSYMGKEKIPQFNLEEGVEYSIELVRMLGGTLKEPKLVAIAGPSASGKTTQVADKIIERLGEEYVIRKLSQDNYFTGEKPWDQPASMDLALQIKHLTELKAGRKIWKPNYSYPQNCRTTYSVFFPGQIVLLEGIFALHTKVAKHADLKIYVDCKPYVMLIRRLLRDCGTDGRTKQSQKEVIQIFLEEVLPLSRKYVEPTRKNADLVIVNNFSKDELERL